MEHELERLRQKIAIIRYQLALLAVEKIEASMEVGEAPGKSPDYAHGQLRELALLAEDDALEAELLHAYLQLGRLIVSAEVERLRRLQPSPSVEELTAARERFQQILKEHRQLASQMYDQAMDFDLACERVNGVKPKPEIELTEQQKREKQQEYSYGYRR